MSADMGPVLAEICDEAAALILPLWRTGLAVTAKADESPVTEADRRGEALILQRLAFRYPEIPVVSEEHASEFGAPEAIGPRFFLVDPIDGTKAFVRGDPNFTVNIALVENGRPTAGAISAPATNETWFTTAAGAAKRVNGASAQPVRARPWRRGDALALVSHTMKPETITRLRETYGFQRTEAMDSSIKFCRLAEGAADIYPRHGPTMEWDIAAGHALLEAAGGSLRSHEGEAVTYGKASEGFRNGWFVARGAQGAA
jgi:3'(2'), 5'-bisphosphate nucleotidase